VPRAPSSPIRPARAAPGRRRAADGLAARLVKLFGLLLMLSALALSLSRAPDRPVESLVARWAPPPSDFLDLDGQLVHLRDEGPRGDALPVVLLHGTSASLHTWEGWAAALRGQRRVITLDLPGFGLTGPTAAADYRPEADARFVLQVLDRLGVRRFVAGGNSLGGEVAWQLAALAPERVERLVLVDAMGFPFESDAVPIGWRLALVPGIGTAMEWVLPREAVEASVRSAYADPARVTPAVVDRYFELTLRAGNRRALVRRLRQVDLGRDAARIAGLRLPTLILWGARDRLIPVENARRFEQAIPGSRLVLFDDLGHVPQEEDPARTVAPVKAFLGLR
jgi:pimeloyl-ACP methyl ester carboxylesterase